MKYIIEKVTQGGWVLTEHHDNPGMIRNAPFAIGETAAAAVASLDEAAIPAPQRLRNINEYAHMIVACDPHSDRPRKINMIKLLRSVHPCSLRDAKEAIERALDTGGPMF